MTQAREGVLDDATVERRLKEELPHWRLEDGWIRRTYKTVLASLSPSHRIR
jgi:4a-hydroxytetrahydrobiopterin dehydratase